MKEIGQIVSVPIKEVWKNGETEFTKWLAMNPDYLGDVIDISISELRPELTIGGIRIDLVGNDESGNMIIVENQFGESNHDHLGKLITYLAAKNADIAVWIVEHARPEHVKAIGLLNQLQNMKFYLLSLDAVKIGDSAPAINLSLIIGPEEPPQPPSPHFLFWTGLISKLQERKIILHSEVPPGDRHWIEASAGRTGIKWCYVIRTKDARIELYIDKFPTEHAAMKILQHFYKDKTEIEETFGQTLDWGILDGGKAFRIAYTIDIGGLRDHDKWEAIQTEMIDQMVKFEKALKPYIHKLDV